MDAELSLRGGDAPTRVIYIMGSPRSGSTLLEIVLGDHAQAESAGELNFLARSGWMAGEYCACGMRGNECPFWSDVRREWSARIGSDDVAAYDGLLRRVEFSRAWMIRGAAGFHRTACFREYARQTRALVKTISAVGGKAAVVDSSKIRSRAYLLAQVPGIDLRVIHLVRDPRGLIWSSQKRLAKDERGGVAREITARPTGRLAMSWIKANCQAEWVRRRLPAGASVCVRYEDFVVDPAGILAEIGPVAGLDLGRVGRRLAAGEPIAAGHTIAGNRMRMAGRVRLAPDVEWYTKLPAGDRWICWTAAGWLMRRYGYRRRAAEPSARRIAA